jgi:hypothetical protein
VTYLVFDRLATRFRVKSAEDGEDGPLVDNPT